MKDVLFVCTHNSSRSQIAEGLVNHYSDDYHAFSAGTEQTQVNPYAIAVLSEIGVDITHHRSKLIDEFANKEFEFVITVCDDAKESCPFFPGAKEYMHMGFSDPSTIKGGDEDILNAFRETRIQISNWLSTKLAVNFPV